MNMKTSQNTRGDWNKFLYEQAGKIVAIKENGKVVDVKFPKNAQDISLYLSKGEVLYLEYSLDGETTKYGYAPSYIFRLYTQIKKAMAN